MQEEQIIEVEVVSIDPNFEFIDSPKQEEIYTTYPEDDTHLEVMNILAEVNESIQKENARVEQDLMEKVVSPRKRIHKKSFSLPASPTFDVPDDINLSISLDDINVDGDLDNSLNDKSEDFNLLEWIQADEENKAKKAKKAKLSRGKDLNLMRAELEKKSKKEEIIKKPPSKASAVRKSVGRRRKVQTDADTEENIDVVTVSPVTKARTESDPTWCPGVKNSKPTVGSKPKNQQNRPKCDLNSMKMKFLAANPIPTNFKKRKDQRSSTIPRRQETEDHDYCSPRRKTQPMAAPKVKQEEKCSRNVLDILNDKKTPRAVDRSWRIGNGNFVTYVGKEEVVETENTQKQSLLKPLKERIEKQTFPPRPEEKTTNCLGFIDYKPRAPYRDPIQVAKEKALRIRERKRAAALKLMDEEVKVKSATLLPILPLAEMTGMTLTESGQNSKKIEASTQVTTTQASSSEYEEIVIVSIGCNTEISIPPKAEIKKSATGFLHQASLFSNITETIIKKTTPMSGNSLLFSIQDMMTTKKKVKNDSGIISPRCAVSPPNGSSPDKPEGANEKNAEKGGRQVEHGEDKVIMHLRKDRIRPEHATISTQTDDDYREPSPALSRRSGQRRRSLSANSLSSSSTSTSSSRSSSSSSSSSSSYSSSSASSTGLNRHGRRGYRSRSRSWSHRSRRSHRKRSVTRSRSRDSRSYSYERRSRSRDRRQNRRWRDHRKNSPEERRIVYVGKLEEGVTKDDLKRKFNPYGPISKVTIHYKQHTKMRYGFVTFERPKDAYNVIENAQANPSLKKYDISFGGRRAFCQARYSDLDNVDGGYYGEHDFYGYVMEMDPGPPPPPVPMRDNYANESFDSLLQSLKRKINP